MVSFAGQVVDRILSVVEEIMRLAQITFPKQPSRAARRLKGYWAVLAALLIVGGSIAVGRSIAGQPAAPASPAVVPAFEHIFLIVMENHAYSQIIGDTVHAPYINNLAQQYGLATQYTAVTHPSLPNYLALAAGSTLGITGDCNPTGTGCSVHVPINAPHIGDALDAAGKSWKSYQESMPVPTTGCPGLSRSGRYSPGRNPFVYFADVQTDVARCRSHIVPYTELSTDLSAGVTPNFVFITPNLCNDMHDCSIATGDGWLKTEVPKILGSTAFTRQKSLLIVTWDEDDFTSVNKVATIFVSPYGKPSFSSAVAYNHYSLLKSIEQGLGAGTVSASTNDVAATAMTDFFGTRPSTR